MGVAYKLNEMSQTKVILDVTGAPDTENTTLPGSPTVRPKQLTLFAYASKGHWAISEVQVNGLKVLDAAKDRLTQRDYVVPFMSVDEEDTEAPEWILEIVDRETARLDAVGGTPDEAHFDELLEASRLRGLSLGAPRVKALAEPEPVDYARQSFNSALNVLLIRENLEGAKWAIQQLLKTAEAAHTSGEADGASSPHHIVSTALQTAAQELDALLDKRAAQLAAKEH
jgi:hypothetical protein